MTILDQILLSIPARLVEEENTYLDSDDDWKPRPNLARDAGTMWSIVHSALIDALEEGADYAEAKMEYHKDGDGFYEYRGTIDVNMIASKIAWHVREKLRLESVKRV
jgi:hypothetical protein